MFQTVSSDFVKSVCGVGEGLSSNESVVAAGSINEASKVKVGTFVIKTKRIHFWQSTSCKFLLGTEVAMTGGKGVAFVESDLLDEFNKEIDLSEKNTFNLSALKQIGVKVEVDYDYKLSANLGAIHRLDLSKANITDFSVPEEVVNKLSKQNSRRVLGVVTSVFTVPNASTLTLSKQLQVQDQISLSKLINAGGDTNVWKRDKVNTLKMVGGQVIAYGIQEVTLDVAAGTFSFPLDGGKGQVINATAAPVIGGGDDRSDGDKADDKDGNSDTTDAASTFIIVPSSAELEDDTISDLVADIGCLDASVRDQLLRLMRSVFKNSIPSELKSFVFELEENFDKLNPTKSVKDFDCDNAQLLALMDFILKDGHYSVNILYYIYLTFQLAQELPVNVLIDVSDLTSADIGLTKQDLIDTTEKCAALNESTVTISEPVLNAAKSVWNNLFVLQSTNQTPDSTADDKKVANSASFAVKELKLNSPQYHVLNKFVQLFLI